MKTEKIIQKETLYTKFMTVIAKKIYPKAEVIWEESLQEGEVAIFACNHSGAIGPGLTSLYLNVPKRPWVVNYAVTKKSIVRFIFHDFLFAEGKKCKPFFWVLSYLMSKLLPAILLKEDPILVYHSNRMVETFVDSVDTLTNQNKSLIIFPERPAKYSEFIFELYEGFVDIAHQYYKETGKALKFFPTYACADLRKILVGKPISYDPTSKPKEQRKIVSAYVKENIDRLGRSLPAHKTVPFYPDSWFKTYGHYVDDMSKYWALFE